MSYYPNEPRKKNSRAGVVIAVIVMLLAVGVLGWVIAVSLQAGVGQEGALSSATPAPQVTAPAEEPEEGFVPLPKDTSEPEATANVEAAPSPDAEPEATPESDAEPEDTAVPDMKRPATTPALDGHTLTYSDLVGSVADIVEAVQPGVVAVTNQVRSGMVYKDYSYGSGVVISTEGYIVTNAHVISGADKLIITCSDGQVHGAEVMGSDPKTDIAVLRVRGADLTAVSIGDSTTLRVGDLVIAIGNALSLELSTSSVTAGIVSALDRTIISNNWPADMIQIDAAINPGNSGGALVNGRGELVGICTMKEIMAGYSDRGTTISAEGIGYAISTKELMPVVEELILYGIVRRPTIGIIGQQVTESIASAQSWVIGVYCESVAPGSGADAAGLREGDIITVVDGNTVEALSDVNAVIKTKKVGDTIRVTYWRGGKTYETDILLGLPSQP